MSADTITAALPITATLSAIVPAFARARTGMFREAPHPPIPAACGVALSLAELAARVSDERTAALVPASLARAVARRRMSFVAGRLCAEEALRRLGFEGPVARGEAGEPLWPAGITGSITHTDHLACALVATVDTGTHGGLGIDSERIDDDASLQAVLSACCTPRERATLFARARPAHEDHLVATAVFALKEAFYKAVHPRVGRFVDFDELEVHALELGAATGHAELRPCLPELAMEASFAGRFNVVDGTVHAVVDLSRRQAR